VRAIFVTLAAIALVPAMPAVAQSVIDTHVEQSGPAGKTPTKAYRPLAREACRTATNHHQTGKIPLTPQVAPDASCLTELAARDTHERRA
jgi:hypothetical protein